MSCVNIMRWCVRFIKIKEIFAISLVVILTACVSAPPLQSPVSSISSSSIDIFRSPLLDQTNHTQQHLNDSKNILYYQTYGGGGAGLGLLAGPFGVAANIKMIESNTMKDVAILNNKININADTLFSDSAKRSGFQIKAEPNSLRLNPYLLVEKTEGEKLMVAAAIIMDIKAKFPNKYLLQLPVKYTVQELASLDADQLNILAAEIARGYDVLIDRIKKESTVDISAEKKITLKSEFLTPRFKFEMPGNLIETKEGVVWVRMVGSVCGVSEADITYKMLAK